VSIISRSNLVTRFVRLILLFTVAGILGGLVPRTPAVVLYDVNFEAPTHVVSQMPTVGFGTPPRNTPSRVNFGQPMIRSESGVLDGQFCRFDSAHTTGSPYSYCQLAFGLDTWYGYYPFYRMTLDMAVESLNSPAEEFAVFADNPAARKLLFSCVDGVGTVVGYGGTSAQTVMTFTQGTRFSIRLDCDRTGERWTIYKNGEIVFEGEYLRALPSQPMGALRLSLSSPQTGGTACVDVDNVRLEGLPEPATLGLVALGSLVAVSRRRLRSAVPG
jgi:hypothetical protein